MDDRVRKPTGAALRTGAVLFGPLVWAVHFLLVYASESVLCRAGGRSLHDAVLVLATVLALLLLLVHAGMARPTREAAGQARFAAGMSRELDALAAIAVILVAAAGMTLPACH